MRATVSGSVGVACACGLGATVRSGHCGAFDRVDHLADRHVRLKPACCLRRPNRPSRLVRTLRQEQIESIQARNVWTELRLFKARTDEVCAPPLEGVSREGSLMQPRGVAIAAL
jgi:hypothetical protein